MYFDTNKLCSLSNRYMKKQSYVLMGDVVKSRLIQKRPEFEKRLDRVLQRVNLQQQQHLQMPIKSWKGVDEIAGVMNVIKEIYGLVITINDALSPQAMRFTIVKGRVDIGAQAKDVTRADGEAFHRAAAMMAALKKTGLLFNANTGQPLEDMALNAQINALLLIRAGWTENQKQIYTVFAKEGNQAAVAKKLKITQQSVSKILKSISASEVEQVEKQVMQWINETY